jgi:protein-S-isoprenylcysteine O-methyltransferase Ste14
VRTAIFVVLTVILAHVSRESLHRPRSHGFYRFFAWEAMLALTMIQAPVWFQNVLAWHQVISWFLLIVSLIPLTLGLHSLRSRGHTDPQRRPEPQLLAFERTTELVSSGVYERIRHPLYSSLLLLTWGLFSKDPSTSGRILAVTATVFLMLTAKADEAECLRTFGERYTNYMKHTSMFIPRLL